MSLVKESLTENVNADFIRRLQEAQSQLLGSVGIENLSLYQLQKLAEGTDFITKEARDVIDVTHEYVYEILSGYVAVFDHEPRPRSLLAWRVPGDLLGDFYFMNPGAASQFQDYFLVTDSCRLLRFDARILRQLIDSHSILLWGISRQLARKAINSRIRAQIRAHKESHAQIAHLFLELIKERGLGGEDRQTLNGTYSYYDFEDFLGCSYSSVSKACKDLMDSRCIEHLEDNANSRKYNILNLNKLRGFAKDEERSAKEATR